MAGARAEVQILEKEPGDAELSFTEKGILLKSKGSFPVLVTSVVLKVSPGTPVSVRSSFGNVTIRGICGVPKITVCASQGRISLKDLREIVSLEASSDQGEIELASSASLGEAPLRTDLAKITVKGIQGAKSLSVESTNGNIVVKDVQGAQVLSITTDGDIEVKQAQVGSQLSARSQRKILVEGSSAPEADLEQSSYGSGVVLRRSTFGRLKVRVTGGGDIRCVGTTYQSKDFQAEHGRVIESK